MIINNSELSNKECIRFLSNVNITKHNKCWEWKGSILWSGYGQFYSNEIKDRRAHRIMFKIYNGKIKKGLCILHKCDNRLCCNPKHLLAGTDKDNSDDKFSKNRGAIGEKNGRSKLSNNDIIKIRSMYNDKNISQKDIAKKFNIHPVHISNIINYVCWKHTNQTLKGSV